MILSRRPPAVVVHLSALRSPLHNSSNAVARGAVAVLPAFYSPVVDRVGLERQTVIVIALAAVAVVALLVAGAAFLNNLRNHPRGIDGEEVFTATPLAMGEDSGRHARLSAHHAFSTLRIPRWVQAGSLVAALAITWVVAQRLQPAESRLQITGVSARAAAARRSADDAPDSPEDLDLVQDSSPAFAFRVRDWVARAGGGCAGRLEVTKGAPSAWSLTARVHDGKGQLIDTARARVSQLREGEVVEFSFPRADCDRIGAWDVRGARPTP